MFDHKMFRYLNENKIVSRIWKKDPTLWAKSNIDISENLGWLDASILMKSRIAELQAFAKTIVHEGFTKVIVLGMGGSSLGAKVFEEHFNAKVNYPVLIVLDSVTSTYINQLTQSLDLQTTLFVVSSKSGTTVEPLALYRYFRTLLNAEVGEAKAGKHFAAITDQNSPLAELAESETFRKVFENLQGIGGRFSVQSFFGLLPAALKGVDIEALLERLNGMSDSCMNVSDLRRNPGVQLGSLLASMEESGKNKLTFISNETTTHFCHWAEQLIAESLGKNGRGIIPIVGEPLVTPKFYTHDRVFVYLRMGNNVSPFLDDFANKLASLNHLVFKIDLNDIFDIGAEFFRWEFAVSIASIYMNIYPFDQPDVQESKVLASKSIENCLPGKSRQSLGTTGSLKELLSKTTANDYLAILAFVNKTPEIEDAIHELRKKVLENYGIVSTLGYGPTYLHSTGQLHKGGPNSGIFLQLVQIESTDIDIPDEAYSLNSLTVAQSQADMESLKRRNRKVVRIVLGENASCDISNII